MAKDRRRYVREIMQGRWDSFTTHNSWCSSYFGARYVCMYARCIQLFHFTYCFLSFAICTIAVTVFPTDLPPCFGDLLLQVFDEIGAAVIDQAFSGYNATVLAYGQVRWVVFTYFESISLFSRPLVCLCLSFLLHLPPYHGPTVAFLGVRFLSAALRVSL